MFKAPQSDYLVPFDGSFRIADAKTKGHKTLRSKSRLKEAVKELDSLQKALYAANRHALLLIFQGQLKLK